MKINLCPECRKSMRRWALDYRKIAKTPETKRICLAMAIDYRSGECFHPYPFVVRP